MVTTPAPGNSGKIEALEYLNFEVWWWPLKHQIPLVGIDLSRPQGEGPRVYLQGIELSGADLAGANLSDTNLSSADLSGANLQNATLTSTWLDDANLDSAILWNSKLGDTLFSNTNLSGADFADANDLKQGQLARAWAWRLDPPKNLPDGLVMTRLCEGTKEEIRAFYADPDRLPVPRGC